MPVHGSPIGLLLALTYGVSVGSGTIVSRGTVVLDDVKASLVLELADVKELETLHLEDGLLRTLSMEDVPPARTVGLEDSQPNRVVEL